MVYMGFFNEGKGCFFLANLVGCWSNFIKPVVKLWSTIDQYHDAHLVF